MVPNTFWRRRARVALILCCATIPLASGCLGRLNNIVLRKKSLQFEYPAQRADQLSWAETVGICGAVARLEVQPATLYIRRGEQIGLVDQLRAMAFDSTGKALGEPRVLDWNFTGREVQQLSDGDLLGRRVGEVEVVVSFPARACDSSTKRSLPSGIVTVVVGDTGTSSRLPVR